MKDTRIYGYARVSSKEQNLDMQIDALIGSGVDRRNIITDKQSGKNFDRPGINSLIGTDTTLPMLRKGDCLRIYSLDRLGRNYDEVVETWKYITRDLECDVEVIDMPILNTTTTGRNLDGKFISDLVLQILSYVAQKEREKIHARQADGIRAAKDRGKHLGRPAATFPDNWNEVYKEWKAGKITAVKAMELTGTKKVTFYKLAKQTEI